MALISDDDFEIKEELINLQSDIVMKNHFTERDNSPEFWIEQQQNFPILSKAVLQILMEFPSSWKCEAGFSQTSIIKTEHETDTWSQMLTLYYL